jgi:predicted permease
MTDVLALAHIQHTMWWITIGMGFVVVVVVVVLLSLLLTFVNDVDKDVDSVLNTAGGVANNTGKLGELGNTVELTAVLRDELGRHAAVLGSLRG